MHPRVFLEKLREREREREEIVTCRRDLDFLEVNIELVFNGQHQNGWGDYLPFIEQKLGGSTHIAR